jgi:hypothetical protein
VATYTRPDGTIIPLNCAGPAHQFWRDVDGTLTGTAGSTLIGAAPIDRSYPYDQSTPVTPGPCTRSNTLAAYQCDPDQSTFLLDQTLKPDPIPAGGIFGNPQLVVVESMDGDSEDRNFSPVFVNVTGAVDLLITGMDHGWCFGYTCQKRLSTFWSYMPTHQVNHLTFLGTPAKVFRLHMPYAAADDEILITINYQGVPNRRFTWAESEGGRIAPETQVNRDYLVTLFLVALDFDLLGISSNNTLKPNL